MKPSWNFSDILLWDSDVDTFFPRRNLMFTVPRMQRDENSKSTNSERSQQAPVAATRFRKLWRVFCPSNSQELVSRHGSACLLTALSIIPQWVSCFLPARSNMVRMSLQECARAWACTCVSQPSERAALLMAVCFCVCLEGVLFPVSRDGNSSGTRAPFIVRSHDVCLLTLWGSACRNESVWEEAERVTGCNSDYTANTVHVRAWNICNLV